MKQDYHEKRFKKRKNNRVLREVRPPTIVGIVPARVVVFKYLGDKKKREIETELPRKEI